MPTFFEDMTPEELGVLTIFQYAAMRDGKTYEEVTAPDEPEA